MISLSTKNIGRIIKGNTQGFVPAIDVLPTTFDLTESQWAGDDLPGGGITGPSDASIRKANEDIRAALSEAERLKKEAAGIVESAKSEAESIIERARRDGYAKGYDEGKEAGYTEGYRIGKRTGEEKAQTVLHKSLSLAEQVQSHLRSRIEHSETDMISFVLEVVQSVIQKEVSEYGREIAEKMIREASRRAVERTKAVVRVHPDDFPGIDVDSIRNGFQEVDLVADPNVE